MNKLSNKTALVTGGNSGMGFTTAETFIANGATVIITGRNEDRLKDAVNKLGSQASYIVADSGKMDDLKNLAKKIGEQNIQLDILFVNAGIAKFAPLDYIDEAFFDDAFNINVKGVFFTVKYLLPYINGGSSIILNASINAHIGKPNATVYAATKASVISLAKTLSAELTDKKIRVNALSPGPIRTPFYDKLGLQKEEFDQMNKELIKQVPMGRIGDAQEIADVVLFLASDASSFMLGSEVVVDGGMSTM